MRSVSLAAVGALAATMAAAAPSPTGRNPIFVWTPERQDRWNQLVTANHPYWQQIRSNALDDNVWGDHGEWRALAFQMTGDTSYAQAVWAKAGPPLQDMSTNHIRATFIQMVWTYEIVRHALGSAERTLFLDGLKAWAEDTLSDLGMGNSDEVVGRYFALAMLDQVTAAEGQPTNYIARSFRDGRQGLLPVGGVDSTYPGAITLRNWVHHLALMAAGGEWIEGTQYNLNTNVYWLMGIDALLTSTGAEHFPEYRALVDPTARRFLTGLTPNGLPIPLLDLEGDPRAHRQPRTVTCFGVFAGSTSDPSIASGLQRIVSQMIGAGEEPDATFYIFNDPYAPLASDWRAVAPLDHHADGQNLVISSTGHGPDDTLFTSQMYPLNMVDFPSPPPDADIVDHFPSFFADFQIHRKGAWALTRPLGYGATFAATANSMLIEGNDMAYPTKEQVAYECAANDACYVAGTNAGWHDVGFNRFLHPDPGSGTPDPPYLAEWTRSLLYLPSSDRQSDTVVVYDRVNARDFRTMPSYNYDDPANYWLYTRVYGLEEEIAANIATRSRREWIIHMPESPVVSHPPGEPMRVDWTAAPGQLGRVTTLVPENPRAHVYDESVLWADIESWLILPQERKWQTRIMPPTEEDWQTMLNVVQVYDLGFTPQSSLVRSVDGTMEGALVRRSGLDDVLVMFSAAPEQRLVSSGYSVSWTASTATRLWLPDLDPSLAWAAVVDGGAPQAVIVSDQGLGRMSVAGAGSHTLTLLPNGAMPVLTIGDASTDETSAGTTTTFSVTLEASPPEAP